MFYISRHRTVFLAIRAIFRHRRENGETPNFSPKLSALRYVIMTINKVSVSKIQKLFVFVYFIHCRLITFFSLTSDCRYVDTYFLQLILTCLVGEKMACLLIYYYKHPQLIIKTYKISFLRKFPKIWNGY